MFEPFREVAWQLQNEADTQGKAVSRPKPGSRREKRMGIEASVHLFGVGAARQPIGHGLKDAARSVLGEFTGHVECTERLIQALQSCEKNDDLQINRSRCSVCTEADTDYQ
jgi:hypothetical protein